MEVLDLTSEHEALYFVCLEDWSDEVTKEAGRKKAEWYARMKDRGLRVKLALDDDGRVGGMIQYLPIEHSTVDGTGLWFIPCIWVHGHRQGRGNFQGRGMGRALLAAAEEDARARGATGMAAWGLWLPFWMRAKWYLRHGYRKAGRLGMALLVWKPFSADAERPAWLKPTGKRLETAPGKVNVTAFVNGWCTARNLVYERTRRAAAEFGDRVAFREVDTFERSAVAEWGEADAVYVDGRAVQSGPPPVGEGGGSARPASLSLQGRASRRRRATAECRLPIPE